MNTPHDIHNLMPNQVFVFGSNTAGGIDVECYVLDDPQKTAVISQSGMGRALGLASGGKTFPRFLATKAMSSLVGDELSHKIENPLKFQWGTGGDEQPPATIHSFDVTLLIDLFRIIIQAETEGKLGERHKRVATNRIKLHQCSSTVRKM